MSLRQSSVAAGSSPFPENATRARSHRSSIQEARIEAPQVAKASGLLWFRSCRVDALQRVWRSHYGVDRLAISVIRHTPGSCTCGARESFCWSYPSRTFQPEARPSPQLHDPARVRPSTVAAVSRGSIRCRAEEVSAQSPPAILRVSPSSSCKLYSRGSS